MQYAQRLLAALPSTRGGLRSILAVLTAFGIVLATAGVAAMPLLNEGKAVEDTENSSACHPAARMVYPEGQSAPEYVVPVYETKYGVESILSDWCSTAGKVLEDPTITLNVVEGKTVTPYLLPGIKAELERPAPTNGEQDVFIPTDYLVKGVREVTGDSGWEVGTKVFSLTYTSGTVSATTGLFSFVKQDPDIINPPAPEPTPEPAPEPTAEPTSEPSAAPAPEPAPEPTAAPTAEPTPQATTEPSAAPSASPTPEPAPTPSPTPSAAPSPSASPSTTASPSSSPSPSQSPKPEPTASAQPSASPSATAKTCQDKPAVQVLSSDGSDLQGAEPAYEPDTAVKVRGTGWCSQGTMLDGEKPVEIKVAAYGGYVVPGTLSVPVTFRHGAFDAQLNLSALYAGGKADKGRYYLQLSPIDSGLTAATNIFVLNKAVAPQPKPEPSPAPSPAPTPTAEPTSEPAPEPTGSPTSPAPTPSAAPSSEPSASPAPSAHPSETASPAPAPQTTEPDQNAPKPSSNDSERPGTDNAAGDNPGGNPGGSGAGSGADTGAGTGAGSRADSSQQASGAGSDSGSTSQDGSAQQPANTGAAPAPTAGGSGGERAHASEDSAASAQASPEADASSQRTVRPDRSPVAPVTSAAHLSADNAGSLSGSRQGNIVNLVLPKSKAQAGEWVSVFVFPGATTKGWVQVDDANSVSIDISTFDSGSYELAVADRDNSLLGWAKLEISSASFDPRNPAQAQLLTFPDNAAAPTKGLSTNDMLLGSAGGLLVVGAVSLLVAAFSGMPLRAPRTSPRLRLPRRR